MALSISPATQAPSAPHPASVLEAAAATPLPPSRATTPTDTRFADLPSRSSAVGTASNRPQRLWRAGLTSSTSQLRSEGPSLSAAARRAEIGAAAAELLTWRAPARPEPQAQSAEAAGAPQRGGRLDELPTELQLEIVKACDTGSLKNLSATSHSWNEVAAAELGERQVASRLAGWAQLTRLARLLTGSFGRFG